MKRSCYSCRALILNKCDLGYKTKMVYPGTDLERLAPNEECPKPVTYEKLRELLKSKVRGRTSNAILPLIISHALAVPVSEPLRSPLDMVTSTSTKQERQHKKRERQNRKSNKLRKVSKPKKINKPRKANRPRSARPNRGKKKGGK